MSEPMTPVEEAIAALEEMLTPLDPDKIGDGPTYIAMVESSRAKARAALSRLRAEGEGP